MTIVLNLIKDYRKYKNLISVKLNALNLGVPVSLEMAKAEKTT